MTATVRETGRPARVDRYTEAAGGAAREIGIRSAVGVPITVEGELWGLIAVVSTSEEPPPPGTEERLAGFTELVATAIANAQARVELRTIADEQAALGRVATLVAQGEAPAGVFAAVAEEVGRLLKTDDALVVRFEPDESVTIVASWTATGEPLPVGDRRHVEPGDGVTPLVRETGRPARIDSQTGYYSELGLESAVAAPITVEGRIWGVVAWRCATTSRRRRIPRSGWRHSLVSSRPRSRMRRAGRSLWRHGRGSWPPPMGHAGVSSATCTTAPSSGWSRGASAARGAGGLPPGLAAELDTFAVGLNGAAG